jgi:DNA-binding transcriptional LysR family regulator
VEADHESVIQALVVAGIGIGLLREELAQREERAGNVVVLDDLFATGRLSFIHAADRTGDRAIAAVKECLAAVWADKADGEQ